MKVKSEKNKEFSVAVNSASKVIVLEHKRTVTVLDIISLGYYKIQEPFSQ